jgi:hypothetical protein
MEKFVSPYRLNLKALLPFFLLSILIAIAFFPSLQGEFSSLDDMANINHNAFLITGNFAGIWTNSILGMYIPVTYSIWGSILHFVSDDPLAFHILNLCLHIINSCLVFSVVRKFLFRWDLSFFVAAVFALHPLQAETVAWLTAGRDLLASFFALFSAFLYLDKKSYLSVLFFFILAMLCKPSVAGLPFLFWSFDYLKAKDWVRTTFRSMPFFLVVMALAILTQNLQAHQVMNHTPLWQKPFLMLECYGFYLIKFLLPISLSADYGRTPMVIWQSLTNFQLEALLMLIAPVVFLFLAVWSRTKDFFLRPALLYFLLLLPISGLIDFGFQKTSAVADHYVYLGLIPLAWLAVNAISKFADKTKIPKSLLISCLIFIFGLLTFQRSQLWQTDAILGESILKTNPQSFMAHVMMTRYFLDIHRPEKAKEHILAENNLRPMSLTSIADKALMLSMDKQFDQLAQMDTALDGIISSGSVDSYSPPFSQTLSEIGRALAIKNQWQHGYERLCLALKYNPSNTNARENLQSLEKFLAAKNIRVSCAF